MRGGAQSHLMRCADGHYYVVKFQNNPQHRRILVNELLGTRLAARLGLPTVPVAIIDVPEELDYLLTHFAFNSGSGATQNNLRVSFGVVFSLWREVTKRPARLSARATANGERLDFSRRF